MAKKVTIQDIADELHLSRNTISKAINNTGNVAPETKNIIFKNEFLDCSFHSSVIQDRKIYFYIFLLIL